MPKIQYLTTRDEEAWDAYVEGHAEGTPFHLTAWRDAVEGTFGHEPHYLTARNGAEICGVLPLVHVKSALFGSSLVSVPLAVYGGVLADDPSIARSLEERAAALARRLRVGHLELRDRNPQDGPGSARDLYVTFRKPLPASADEILGEIPRKTRRMVRLGIKADLRGRVTRAPSDVDAFYDLFARNLRKLGTPAFPKSLIKNLLGTFGERADLLMVESEGRVVAGVLNLYFRDEVLPYYSGTDDAYNPVGVSNFLYYDLMARAVERGCRIFDFGRSKLDTGPYHFKRHFGFEPTPLPYRYLPIEKSELPELNPTNPKYARAIELWKKLPLKVTTTLGPWIVRGIP